MALKVEDLKLDVELDNRVSLLELSTGNSGIVLDVPDNIMLSTLGIRKGKMLHCRGHQLFGGPVVVKTGERQIALHRRLAEKITIQPV